MRLKAIVIASLSGFAAAFIAGAAVTLLVGPGGLVWYCGIVAGLITAYLVLNLSGNRTVAGASAEQKRVALAREPEAGRALLYVYREGFVAKLAGLDIAIDGRPVAQLKSPRSTCIGLPAGPHILTAGFGGLAGPQNKTGHFAFEAAAGSTIAIRIASQLGAVQGSLDIATVADPAAARKTLAGMTMVPADLAEL
jgi:hypothetical protein